MGRIATTVEEQIVKLRSRGIIIDDEKKAKEILLDIGYYRLGYYFFPFEKDNRAECRVHDMQPGTKFTDAVALYYFDFEIRNLLLQYTSRIEVAFRTTVTYLLSNKYKDDPFWFVNPQVVAETYIASFDASCYEGVRKYATIIKHHKKYPSDKYAPAWKTLEHFTFGNIVTLYKMLLDTNDKRLVARRFGINQSQILVNYLDAVRNIRNVCAHSSLLYDLKLYKQVRRGPAGHITNQDSYRIGAAIKVITFLLGKISLNRQRDMVLGLNASYEKLKNKNIGFREVVKTATAMDWELPSISQLIFTNH